MEHAKRRTVLVGFSCPYGQLSLENDITYAISAS